MYWHLGPAQWLYACSEAVSVGLGLFTGIGAFIRYFGTSSVRQGRSATHHVAPYATRLHRNAEGEVGASPSLHHF